MNKQVFSNPSVRLDSKPLRSTNSLHHRYVPW